MQHIKKTWSDFEFDIAVLAERIKTSKLEIKNIYGKPRGGLVIAVRLSHLLGIPLITDSNFATSQTLWVDDVVDSGNTLENVHLHWKIAALYWNPQSSFKPDIFGFRKEANIWIDFPWEMK